jgi:hypothetical protein
MPLSFSLVYYNRQGFYAPDTSALGKTNFFKITKIDTAKNFVSGLFAFTLYRETNQGIDRTDSVVINEGRFDLRYYPQ